MLARYIPEVSAVITFVIRRLCRLLVTDAQSVRRQALDAVTKVRGGPKPVNRRGSVTERSDVWASGCEDIFDCYRLTICQASFRAPPFGKSIAGARPAAPCRLQRVTRRLGHFDPQLPVIPLRSCHSDGSPANR